jgi:hypothetical protein
MFHGKSMIIIKVELVAKAQIITIDVNVVYVNVATRSKTIEKQVLKDRQLRKTKSAAN